MTEDSGFKQLMNKTLVPAACWVFGFLYDAGTWVGESLAKLVKKIFRIKD